MIRAKRCKICDKLLRIQNKSGYCSHHYSEKLRIIKRKRLLINKRINKIINKIIDEMIIDYEIDKVFGDINAK